MARGITEAAVEEIKSRIDLADLAESYGLRLKRAGSNAKACCPFHHEKTPSFNINSAKGFYHCFGCGESGDAIKFVQKQEGLSFVEAVKKLAERCGIKLEETEDREYGRRNRLYALMAELAQFYRRCLKKTKEAQAAREYLASRDLSDEVQEEFLIGYAMQGASAILKWAEKYGYGTEELEAAGVVKAPSRAGGGWYHRFGGRLIFTIRDRQGRVVAFSGRQLVASKNSGKYVNSPETEIFKKSKVLFGFDKAAANIAKSPNREAIVCEGQIDTIRLHSCGFPVAVASQGTAFTEEHVKALKRVADAAVLAFDDDAAGHKAAIHTAGLMLAAEMPVRIARLPDGEDPDSFLRKHGAEGFRKILDAAESIVHFQFGVERGKERNPASIDAVNRISKALLSTIAACPNAVMRASMANEAAKLLGLPASAVNEELSRTKPERRDTAPEAETEEDGGEAAAVPDAESIPGGDAAEAIAPPKEEMAFLQFLSANVHSPDAGEIRGIVDRFVPDSVFACGFSQRFVQAWREDSASGSDGATEKFAAGLSARERGWYDATLIGVDWPSSCELEPVEILQDCVRVLWARRLRRMQGELPARGDAGADMKRIKISMELKRIRQSGWSATAKIIEDIMKGEC